MRGPEFLPYAGTIVWLTSEQGGRKSGPPTWGEGHDYAATAFVPPETVETGLASFALRGFDHTCLRSSASGGWLIVDGTGPQSVGVGQVIVVTEGPRPVGYFTVTDVDPTSTRNNA